MNIGNLFQTGVSAGPAQRKNHDGLFGDVNFEHSRIIFQIGRQISHGRVHFVFNLGEDLVNIGAGDKFDVDPGLPFRADRFNFFYPIGDVTHG